MAADIEIYDPMGRLTFRATDYLARVLGTAYTNGVDGSYTTPYPIHGTLWATALPPDQSTGLAPTVTTSGNTVFWSYGAGARQPVFITFGCF